MPNLGGQGINYKTANIELIQLNGIEKVEKLC